MLFNDGTYEIYIIQTYGHNQTSKLPKKWFTANIDHFLKNAPYKLTNIQKSNDKYPEPYRSFTACGDCWQKTGIVGVFNYKVALRMKKLLEKYNEGREFRIAKLTVMQKIEPC